jgi:hypothetical protein
MIRKTCHGNGRGCRQYHACAGEGRSDWLDRQPWLRSRSAVGLLRRALSDARSVKLHRGLARHRHHAVESIYGSRNGFADSKGAPLCAADNGRGTVVGRCAPNRAYFSGAGLPGIARGYGRLYGSGRNIEACRPSGRYSQELGCRHAYDRDDHQFGARRERFCRHLCRCGNRPLERFPRGRISFLDRRCNRHCCAPPCTASAIRAN